MKIRRFLLFLLLAVLCTGAMTVHAEEGDIASGVSGDLTWRIDAEGELIITGNGNFEADYNYAASTFAPEWADYYEVITSAKVIVTGITDTSGMFAGLENLKSIDLSGLNTDNVTSMYKMFYECGVEELDLSGLNTENVTTMEYLFAFCFNLKSINLSGFNTSKVTNMSDMFESCYRLTSLDLSSFDTHNVRDMSGMFYECENLGTLDLSGFNTSKVTSMRYMFGYAYDLTSVNLSSFNVENVSDMSAMFMDCQWITELDLSNFYTKNATTMDCMFYNCINLENLTLNNFDTSNVREIYGMFQECHKLTTLDLSSFDLSNVSDADGMFYNCYKLKTINTEGLTFSKDTEIEEIFYNCHELVTSITLDCKPSSYKYAFSGAADLGGKIRVYYTDNCPKSTAQAVVNTKSTNSKVYLMNGLETWLEPPVLVSVAPNAQGLSVSWNTVSGASKYRLYYKTASGSWTKAADTSANSYTVPSSKLTSGTTYYFTVRCMTPDCESFCSEYDKKGISYTYLSPIFSDSLTLSNALGGPRIEWPAVAGAYGYYIYRKTSGGSYSKIDYTYGSTNYIDLHADSGETYTYCVRAFADDKSMGWYSGKSIKCLSTIWSSDLTLANGLNGVKVSYKKVIGADGYYIYRRTTTGNYKKIGTISGGSNLTYTDETAVGGTTYFYCVRAYSGSTLGNYNGKSILYLKAITASDLTLTNTRNGARIAWNKVAGADGYYIYRRTPDASYKKIGTVTSASTLSYTDATAANGTTYLYCVRAFNNTAFNYTTLSNYAGKTTVRLSTTDISSLTNISTLKMTIKWAANAKSTGYQIQYSTGSSFASGTYKTVTVSSASAASKTIGSLTKGKTYYVRMRSYKTVGSSYYFAGWSTVKSVKISK